jgi:hypothetical protein
MRNRALVAQGIRARASGARGRRFESFRGHHSASKHGAEGCLGHSFVLRLYSRSSRTLRLARHQVQRCRRRGLLAQTMPGRKGGLIHKIETVAASARIKGSGPLLSSDWLRSPRQAAVFLANNVANMPPGGSGDCGTAGGCVEAGAASRARSGSTEDRGVARSARTHAAICPQRRSDGHTRARAKAKERPRQ